MCNNNYQTKLVQFSMARQKNDDRGRLDGHAKGTLIRYSDCELIEEIKRRGYEVWKWDCSLKELEEWDIDLLKVNR